MSKFNGAFKWIQVLAVVVIVAGAACSDTSSSSGNWNKLFGRNDDRRVEPRGNAAADANRSTPGASAAKSETASNNYERKNADAGPTTPDRGDPGAIEQYAANINPPAHNSGPHIRANRPQPGSSGTQTPPPTMSNSNTNPTMAPANNDASPVRVASDRPDKMGAGQPTPPANAASGDPSPTRGNAMFNPANSASPSANNGRASLPTVEDRAAQPAPDQPTETNAEDSDSSMNSAPVISNVTARPVERDPISAARARTNNKAAADTERTDPPVDSAAEQRRREITAQEAKVAADPTNVEEQFKLRTMYLLEGRDDEALAPIRGVTPDVQEIMLAQLRSLQAAGSGDSRNPATWANRQLEAMKALQEKLRAKADLQVPKVELCTEIRQFGVYTPFPSTDFKAGAPNDVLIYVEVDNFKSEQAASGEFRTLLSARLVLMNSDGKELVSLDEPNIEDFSRGVRRDFFLAFGPITIPANLPVGEYTVKVYIEDKLAGKVNSNKTSLRLVP